MTLSLQSVRRGKSLYEQTYEALRTSILSGELLPGERLVETHLAEQLQVSRTPIREAMRQLQREALVIADANGGLRVTTISAIDAEQLYDCRIALEQLSVQQACQHITSEQLQALEKLVVQAEQLVADVEAEQKKGTLDRLAASAPAEMLDLDYRFHRLIAESSGNSWLVSLLDQVFDKMTLLRVQTTHHNPYVLEIRSEHRQIFEAIVQRDGNLAAQNMQKHLSASKVRVIQELQRLYSGMNPES